MLTSILIALRKWHSLTVLEVLSVIIIFCYVLISILLKKGIYWIAFHQVVGNFVFFVSGFFILVNYFSLNFSVNYVRKYITFSLPFALSTIISYLFDDGPKVIVGKYLGQVELGYLQIATKFYGYIDKVIKILTNVMFPELAYRCSRISMLQPFLFKIEYGFAIIGAFLFSAIILLFPDIILIFYGKDVARAGLILQFYSLIIFSKLFWRPYRQIMYILEKHQWLSLFSIVNLILGMLSYYILMPLKIGNLYLGSIVIIITEFVLWIFPTGIYNIIVIPNKISVHWKQVLIKIWGVAFVILLLIKCCFKSSIISFPIFVALYLPYLLTLKESKLILYEIANNLKKFLWSMSKKSKASDVD
jgi:O-antigen/teichoic acid export membrane protein